MSNTSTETRLATEGQISFAATNRIEGVTAETPFSEAVTLTDKWIKANPLPANQQRERTADLPADDDPMVIVTRFTRGGYQPKNREAAEAFIADLESPPEERAKRRAEYRARQARSGH
jgi:hypothetical protein